MGIDIDIETEMGTLLTIGETARRLGVSTPTLRTWDNAGLLRAVRTPGNRRLFRRADVEAVVGDAEGRLLPRAEVAARLGVCSNTVRNYERAGKLPSVRLPSGELRYAEADVERLAKAAPAPKADLDDAIDALSTAVDVLSRVVRLLKAEGK